MKTTKPTQTKPYRLTMESGRVMKNWCKGGEATVKHMEGGDVFHRTKLLTGVILGATGDNAQPLGLDPEDAATALLATMLILSQHFGVCLCPKHMQLLLDEAQVVMDGIRLTPHPTPANEGKP